MLTALRSNLFGSKAKPNGSPHGHPYGTAHEIADGEPYEDRDRDRDGTRSGTQSQASFRPADVVGARFDLDPVRGVVCLLKPGETPTIPPVDFVDLFIGWLQSEPIFRGNEVEGSLLRDTMLPAFRERIDKPPALTWTQVSQIMKLRGVTVRQEDGRCKPKRDGHAQNPTLYRIPRKMDRRRRRS